MKSILFFALALLFSLPLPAQTPRCDYAALMRDGETFFKKREYKKALNKYNAAKTCDIARTAEVDKALNEVFKAIEKEKTDAINARKEADNQRNIAIQQTELAIKNSEEAKRQRDTATVEREKAEARTIEIQRQKEASDKSARANLLAALSVQKAQTDYTLGWHLAYLAYEASYDSAQGGGTEPGVNAIMHGIISDTSEWMARPLKGHTSDVNGAVFSPDGQFILTYSGDSTARLWDKSGLSIKTLEGHFATLRDGVFSPDGQFILTCGNDNMTRLWDKNGLLIKTLEGHTNRVSGVVFSPDGQFILTRSDDGTARLWEAFPLYIQHHWSLGREDFLKAGVREEDLPVWVK